MDIIFTLNAWPVSILKQEIKGQNLWPLIFCLRILIAYNTRHNTPSDDSNKRVPAILVIDKRSYEGTDVPRNKTLSVPCTVYLLPSSIRGLAASWISFLHWLLSSTDLSKRSPVTPVHFVMLFCQRVLGLHLLWPEVVPCIISFSMQFPSFHSTWP